MLLYYITVHHNFNCSGALKLGALEHSVHKEGSMFLLICLIVAFFGLFFGAPFVGHAGYNLIASIMSAMSIYLVGVISFAIIGVEKWKDAFVWRPFIDRFKKSFEITI